MKLVTIVFLNFISCSFMYSQKQPLRYLALGDSYTIGESVKVSERWPDLLVSALAQKGISVSDPRIIATTGWRTDNLKDAIEKAELNDNYDLVSLLIGVNNQYQGKPVDQYANDFEDLLKTAIRLAKGNSKYVFVVSIPDYGYTPFGRARLAAISTQIDEFNEINKRIAEQYHVAYYNITEISRKGLEDPSLVAPDGLHPSGKMYSQWVDLIMENFVL